MFIEKLKDEEIIGFFKDSLPIFSKDFAERGKVGRYGDSVGVFVKFDNGVIGTITLNDFRIATDKIFFDLSLNLNWKNFMYQKFGDEYKQAFNENLKKKYEEEMIK